MQLIYEKMAGLKPRKTAPWFDMGGEIDLRPDEIAGNEGDALGTIGRSNWV